MPLISFFAGHSHAVVRNRKIELEKAMQAWDFSDKLMYFACHGSVTGSGSSLEQASLTLSDDDPILTTDIIEWLGKQPLLTNPIVFIGACQGGQMSSMFYDAFGLELLKGGANCVLGPQVDLPSPFAAEYAIALFSRFLNGERLGDVVQDIARQCLLDRHNPLGLIVSMYRGLDTRLVAGPNDG